MDQQIGFIGTGNMGTPMAHNLLATGFKLRVFNRTAEKLRALLEEGAERAGSLEEIATCPIVITMVADDAAEEALAGGGQGLAATMGRGAIHLAMSTISPQAARRIAHQHAEHGSMLLNAPVLGRPEAAAARKLTVLLSGPAVAKPRVRPLLEAMGQAIYDFGESAGGANVAKLCANFLIGAAIEALGEGLTMVEKAGLDPAAVVRMLGETLFACPVYQGYGARIATRDFADAGFRMALGLKDVNLVLKQADELQAPMPLASLLRDRALGALARGHQDLDWAAMTLVARADAGLK